MEHKAAPSPERKKAVMQAILYSYHSITGKEVVFDKSRGWVTYIDLIESLTEERMKILCTVRPMVDILASLEKLYRRTSVIKQAPGEAKNYHQFLTVAGRCEFWMRPDQLVGIMIKRIDEAINRGQKDRIHFIQYEDLTKQPVLTMRKAYDFLGEDYYQHDFDNVEQVTIEDDDVHGFIDLHKIKQKVEYVPSNALQILGKEVYEKYKDIYFKLK